MAWQVVDVHRSKTTSVKYSAPTSVLMYLEAQTATIHTAVKYSLLCGDFIPRARIFRATFVISLDVEDPNELLQVARTKISTQWAPRQARCPGRPEYLRFGVSTGAVPTTCVLFL